MDVSSVTRTYAASKQGWRYNKNLMGRVGALTLGLFFTGLSPGEATALKTPPGMSHSAVKLGLDLDGDGDPDVVEINLEVIEVRQEVYPGKQVTFWVFAPEGKGMRPIARVPSPTIRVEEGDVLRIRLRNTHYFPHTIHFHGTIHPNSADGVPDITQKPVSPGEGFLYEFKAVNPGTHWYHCHVQPDVHVLMGLVGMFIIEPNRPNNHFRHLIIGAGEITDLAKAQAEQYDREYSLVYMDVDERLNALTTAYADPRQIEKKMHREYNSTKREANIFLLNGRSFPYTLRDTPIAVKPNERVKLRVLNAGARTVSLHTHGHHPILTHLDGYPVPEAAQVTRDVFTIGPAQRVDLELRTTPDSYHASGPGVWLMHDHTEQAVTNNGINPGGDITVIAYEGFIGADGLPKVPGDLSRFFNPDFYLGKIPVFDPKIFHSTYESYEDFKGASTGHHQGSHGHQEHVLPGSAVKRHQSGPHGLEDHRIVANQCEEPRGLKRLTVRGGIKYAREGEVYAFEPRSIQVNRCEKVQLTLINEDEVRHAFMLPGLNPMFAIEFTGPGQKTASFVAPDKDITLEFHCHVETHEKMGMHGEVIVGRGGKPKPVAHVKQLYEGVGVILEVDRRDNQLVLDHEEIKGFMAKMIMGYPVSSPALLRGLKAGDQVRFTIDAAKQAIVEVVAAEQKPKIYEGEGEVRIVDLKEKLLVVKHGEIKGFMGAMTMGYPVSSADLLKGLKKGDRIKFKIDAEKEVIIEITLVK